MAYEYSRQLEEGLRKVESRSEKTWNQVELAQAILEAFGELEHDPSLVWPAAFDHVSQMTDEDVEKMTEDMNQRLSTAVDVLKEVFAYIVLS